MTQGYLSERGMMSVTSVVPRIPKTVLEAGDTLDEGNVVDISVAENWLVRDDILNIVKEIIAQKLQPEV